MDMVISAFNPLTVPKDTKKDFNLIFDTTIYYMNSDTFKEFLELNCYSTRHEETSQIIGGLNYIMFGNAVVAQYWNSEEEYKKWLKDNRDAW